MLDTSKLNGSQIIDLNENEINLVNGGRRRGTIETSCQISRGNGKNKWHCGVTVTTSW